MDFQVGGQNVSKYLGCFCKKICNQELSKIAQSGHTVGSIPPAKIVSSVPGRGFSEHFAIVVLYISFLAVQESFKRWRKSRFQAHQRFVKYSMA